MSICLVGACRDRAASFQVGEGGGMLVDFYSISLNELNESSKNYAEFTYQIKKVFHFVWKSNQNFF